METDNRGRISNIPQLRVENLLSIMRVVFYKKTTTRKEIGEITGLAPTTISQLTGKLISEDIITLKGKEDSTGGRQPDFIEFNPKGYFAIGISIGVSQYHGIISDMYGREILSYTQNVENMYSNEELEENIVDENDIIEGEVPVVKTLSTQEVVNDKDVNFPTLFFDG